MQILPIESFLSVAWPGIPLQKLCVLWVHWWLCLVCHACDVIVTMPHGMCPTRFTYGMPISISLYFQSSTLSLNSRNKTQNVDCFLWLYVSFFLQAFQEHGEIEEGAVIYDKVTGKSRGYGFITFKNMESTQQALRAPSKLIDVRFSPFCCFGFRTHEFAVLL